MATPELLETQNFQAHSEPGPVGPWTYETGLETEPVDERFALVGKIFRTSTSEVYAAYDYELGDVAAFKSYYDATEEDLLKNTWERKLMEEFKDDPRVISPLHIGEHDQSGVLRRYLVTPLATGGTLRKTRAHNEAEAREVFSNMRDVSAGVEALRERFVLHQDVKPGNAFVFEQASDNRRVVIGDLGTVASTPVIESDSPTKESCPDPKIAKILGEKVIRPAKFNGYVPPEAHRRGEVDPACDVYAIGAMTSEMLTGKVPRIDTRHWDDWTESYVDGRRFTPDSDPILMQKIGPIPKEIIEITRASLDENPENRPTATELREHFEAAL